MFRCPPHPTLRAFGYIFYDSRREIASLDRKQAFNRSKTIAIRGFFMKERIVSENGGKKERSYIAKKKSDHEKLLLSSVL